MAFNKVSIIVPIYNEEKTLREIIKRVEDVYIPLGREIILVDDHSTDNTASILKNLEQSGRFKVIYKERNEGKGAALLTGFGAATGDIIMIQDADLEYDPGEYEKLLKPLLAGEADVVYGSRMAGNNDRGYWYYYLGNYFLAWLTRVLYNCRISDIETCYKFFKRDILDKIKIKAASFDFEAEFTAKILKNKFRVMELPISYDPRSFAEGKKINWKDGVQAIWILIKYRFGKND